MNQLGRVCEFEKSLSCNLDIHVITIVKTRITNVAIAQAMSFDRQSLSFESSLFLLLFDVILPLILEINKECIKYLR